jgi:signal transduction histidine kinase
MLTDALSASIAATILVVDDQPQNRELLEAYLTAAGYRVRLASNGREALAAVAAARPDVVLLDVLMPEVDGYEVCRQLKAHPETAFIPVVILTALQDVEHRLHGIETGADEFLTKPFNHVELLTRVRSLLRAKALHDEILATNRQLEERVAERTAALEGALRDLRETDRLKTEFLANISHELLTPLTPIKGYLPALLQEVFGPLTLEQRQTLEIVARSVDRLHGLIENLLTFMRWEAGHAPVRLDTMALEAVVGLGVEITRQAAREKGVELGTDIAPDLPPIRGDLNALTAALRQVLDNAVKFTPEGGQVILRMRRTAARNGQSAGVELAVEDTGVGIPPEALPRIFDKFYQADASATRQHGGTGLGLAIVKRILDAHGAAIAVDSRAGRGTRVRMQFPAAS